jgi:hypothetical protein
VLLITTAAEGGLMSKVRIAVGNQLYWTQNAERPWSLNLEDDPACYRFELRAGDRWVGETQVATVERSELSGPGDETDPAIFRTPVWTAYQFRIEPGPPSTAPWVVLGDWHVRPDPDDTATMSSPWQLELRKGDILVFDIRLSSEKPVLDIAPELHVYTSPAPITRGEWHSIVSVADFDWRPKGEGGVTVWLDGATIADYRGPFGYDTARPPYFKFGVYRAAAPETLAVDYANVETSRYSLASHIHAPPPICSAK